ncbi:MAG: hypothetical protein KDA46_15120, partial [Parvularculaceae bacterium]|nr:hypothetical protein [Parvularculaceae bacterium]
AEHEFHLLAPPAPAETDDEDGVGADSAEDDGADADAPADEEATMADVTIADEAPPAHTPQESTYEAPPAAGNDAEDDNESADERLAKDADAARGVS